MKLYIYHDMKRVKWLVGGNQRCRSDLLAHRSICGYMGLSPKKTNIVFEKGAYGKPYVRAVEFPDGTTAEPPVYFSLSHSGSMAMCAVAGANIGADCQAHFHDRERCERIARRWYAPEEIRYLAGITDDYYYESKFFEIWARKEAYVKFTGKGLSEGLATFSVIAGCDFAETVGEARFLRIPASIPGYSIAVCIHRSNVNKPEYKIY